MCLGAISGPLAIVYLALALFPGGWGVPIQAVIGFFGAAIATYFLGYDDSMLDE